MQDLYTYYGWLVPFGVSSVEQCIRDAIEALAVNKNDNRILEACLSSFVDGEVPDNGNYGFSGFYTTWSATLDLRVSHKIN